MSDHISFPHYRPKVIELSQSKRKENYKNSDKSLSRYIVEREYPNYIENEKSKLSFEMKNFRMQNSKTSDNKEKKNLCIR